MLKLAAITVLVYLATVTDCRVLRQKRQTYRYISPFQAVNPQVGTQNQVTGQQALGQIYQCQGDGAFADPDDCSKFFQCFSGIPSHMNCPEGLEFNPSNTWCDFPANVPQNSCQRVTAASTANAPCQATTSTQAYYVGHPTYCNAFFNCGNGLLYPGCTFCGEGLYYDDRVNLCVPTFGVDATILCIGKTYIRPIDQELDRLEASCRPGRNDSYAPLRAKIKASGYPNNLINNRVPNTGGVNPYPNTNRATTGVVNPYYPNTNTGVVNPYYANRNYRFGK